MFHLAWLFTLHECPMVSWTSCRAFYYFRLDSSASSLPELSPSEKAELDNMEDFSASFKPTAPGRTGTSKYKGVCWSKKDSR